MDFFLIIELEALLIKSGKTSADIIRATEHTPANVSKMRNGKIKSIRFQTLLDVCIELDCQPGDLIKMVSEEELDALVLERSKAAAERMKSGLDRPASPEKVYVVDLG